MVEQTLESWALFATTEGSALSSAAGVRTVTAASTLASLSTFSSTGINFFTKKICQTTSTSELNGGLQ